MYLLSPPYAQNRERFSQGVLPDPITNGPFVGSRNPFGPIGALMHRLRIARDLQSIFDYRAKQISELLDEAPALRLHSSPPKHPPRRSNRR